MKSIFYNSSKNSSIEFEQFRTRLLARICVLFICAIQLFQRLFSYFNEANSSLTGSYIITAPFLVVLALVIIVELLLYRKLGINVLKYAKIVDAVFFIVFTGEWMVTLYGVLDKPRQNHTSCYSVTNIFGFTSFGWRTLLQTFVVQRWQLKAFAPTCAYIMVAVFSVNYDPQHISIILLRAIPQTLYCIFIFYFEDKINLRLLLTGLHQQKWLQINDFILANIPEKIAILDLGGELKYMSDFFKSYISMFGYCQNIKQFFGEIKDISRQYEDPFQTTNREKTFSDEPPGYGGIVTEHIELDRPFPERIDSLMELVTLFQQKITKGNLTEKSFFIFNGRLNAENSPEERSIEVKISFIKQHSVPYIIIILRDTTQRDHLLTLEGNIRYKDYLLASVSHELRTPLNGNMNLLEAAIKARDVSDRVKEDLLIPALKSSKFLLHLINDILDMSQIKVQKLRLAFQRANLRETFMNTIQLLEHHARKKGVNLDVSFEPCIPFSFCTDHTRLSQIVLNLMSNSIKFTHEGFVRLKIETLEDPHLLEVSVEDTGIGMTDDEISQLFKDFTHIENKNRTALNPRGVGLGLSIAHNLAKLLGPKDNEGISVVSVPDKGSKFSFVIEDKQGSLVEAQSSCQPVSTAPEEPLDEGDIEFEPVIGREIQSRRMVKKAVSEIGVKGACKCSKVLVVDDDQFNILAYESVLNSLNTKCDTAYNGKSALEKLSNRVKFPCGKNCRPYSVIFMDQEMPVMNGVETVSKIREMQRIRLLPQMKIIGCTAHKGKDEIENFISSGIDCCIEKPISASMIGRILEENNIKHPPKILETIKI